MNAQNLTKLVLLELSKHTKSRLFRNNVGKAWQGKSMNCKDGSILLQEPRIIHFGLTEGSSDLIGWTTKTITPEMVGQQVAVFTAVEIKINDRASKEQLNFIEQIRKAGGIAGIAKTPEQAVQLVENMK